MLRIAELSLALVFFVPLTTRAEDSFDQHYRLATEDVRKNKFADAAVELQAASRQNPGFPGLQKELGLALFQAKDFGPAVVALGKARTAAPDDIQVLLALGTSLARLRQLEQAQAVFADLLQRHSQSPALHLLWGQAYASESQTDEAEQEFHEALRLDPKLAAAHYNLGLLLLKQNKLPEAKE